MNEIMQYASYLMAVIGILAFLVSAITEVVKNIPILKRVPTDLVVMVLSMLVTVVAFFALLAYLTRPFVWYELVAAIVIGFLVAFVAMYGWAKFTELWARFKTNK